MEKVFSGFRLDEAPSLSLGKGCDNSLVHVIPLVLDLPFSGRLTALPFRLSPLSHCGISGTNVDCQSTPFYIELFLIRLGLA